jgi:hypothetical protein
MNIIVSIILSVAILYASAGACFLFFRFIRPETEKSLRYFLESHYRFFTERPFGDRQKEASRKAIRESGARGWFSIGFSPFLFSPFLISSDLGLSYWGFFCFFINSGVIFFGGLMFAYSWYGLRCLRILGLDSYSKHEARKAEQVDG